MIDMEMSQWQLRSHSPEMARLEPWFFTEVPEEALHMPLANRLGAAASFIGEALEFCAETMRAGCTVQIPLYSQEKILLEPDKAQTMLTWFPGRPGAPFAVVIPGGGYVNVCALTGGFPAAYQLSKMGYHAFVLHYRVRQSPLLPKPLEDLAQAIARIRNHADMFQTDPERYALSGFSAGGHMALLWGTQAHGYALYDLPKPEMLLLGYPAVSSEGYFENWQGEDVSYFLDAWCGKGHSRKDLLAYCVELLVGKDFPPCYIAQSTDDPVVPCESTLQLQKAFQQYQIPHFLRLAPTGTHAFGLGFGTELEGWLPEAVHMWETLNP